VIVLGFDTATAATVVALLDSAGDGDSGDGTGTATERRHDPAPGVRPGHAPLLLGYAHELLDAAGLRFADVDRIAVGLGPGGFTGLRIGVATARALAQSADAELVGVSTLQALASGAHPRPDQSVLSVIDARRGEVFVAGWRGAEQVLSPRAVAPAAVAELDVEGWLAVGDGALRFRADLQAAGCTVPEDSSAQHGVSARTVCRIALRAPHGTARDLVVPDYLRKPDAVRSTKP
jgi:tRNA threonylcarbamoyladenosine biosynthesis protein TsaB